MKIAKKLALILFFVLVLAALASCVRVEKPCDEHKDDNEDGICDVCNEELSNEGGENGETGETVTLIKDGVAKFQIVAGDDLPQTVRNALTEKVGALGAIGIEVKIVGDREDTMKTGIIDVLVGTVTSRGEACKFNAISLGPEGEAIKLVDGKIIVAGGMEDTTLEVIDKFFSRFVGLKEDTVEINDATVKVGKFYEEIQTEYRLTSFTINGNDVKDYVIIWDSTIPEHRNATTVIRNCIFEVIGYWLEIKDVNTLETVPEKAIIIKKDLTVKSQGGFKVYVEDKQLVFASSFADKADAGAKSFLDSNVKIKKGNLDIPKKLNYTVDQRYVYYSEFGAVGLGEKTEDDFLAIIAAHNYANQYGYTVVADPGAKYYIGNTGSKSITIMTDVMWGDATFIIDDSGIAPEDSARSTSLFNVKSDYAMTSFGSGSDLVKSIKQAIADSKGTLDFTKLTNFFGYAPGYDAMLLPYDSTHKVYIRYGQNANAGSDQHEVIVIDKDGNIDKDTPFLLNYTNMTSVTVVRIDDTPITLSGGTMITVANQAPCAYTYYSRNISIRRSNVTIRGLVHKIEGEGDTGAPYSGFIGPSYANNLLVDKCTFQAHRTYVDEASYLSHMGTYELGGSNANKLYYKNCTQSNYYDREGNATSRWYDENGNTALNNKGGIAGIWGVMGTNYCKNITYDNCTLNRLDAHAGVYNASVINGSNVININLIGGGTAIIKDSTIHNSSLITLRSDYGSTWQGDIIIDNVRWVTTAATPVMISGSWVAHNFGYTTYLPTRIIINKLEINGPATQVQIISAYGGTADVSDPNYVIKQDEEGNDVLNPNPLVFTEKIIINNCGSMPFIVSSKDSPLNRIPIYYDVYDEE